ncbi:hypothetical protein, partial [Alistipes timonensis]
MAASEFQKPFRASTLNKKTDYRRHTKRKQVPLFKGGFRRIVNIAGGTASSRPEIITSRDEKRSQPDINTKKTNLKKAGLEEAATYSPTGKPQYHRR